MERRRFLLEQLALLAAAAVAPGVASGGLRSRNAEALRPPGAVPEEEFPGRCIRCGQCAEVCPNRAIRAFGWDAGPTLANTPYIVAREKACILCMKCGAACPTGALTEIPREAEAIVSKVSMGRAVVDRNLCLSYQGKSCGVCYRACPLPDVALRVGMLEQPHVLERCVGCGLCERACIQIPQAIRVVPTAG